jgi:hypothetical protein
MYFTQTSPEYENAFFWQGMLCDLIFKTRNQLSRQEYFLVEISVRQRRFFPIFDRTGNIAAGVSWINVPTKIRKSFEDGRSLDNLQPIELDCGEEVLAIIFSKDGNKRWIRHWLKQICETFMMSWET